MRCAASIAMALSHVAPAAVARSASSPVPCLAASTRIFRKAGIGASGRISRIRTAESNVTRSDREAGRSSGFDTYSFYDRLHGNIAQCVMLTWQHRSPKDRESLPCHEQVQGERTSVPSSGVATIRVRLRTAAERFCAQRRRGSFAGARASLPTAIPKMFPITRRLAGRRRARRFRSIVNVENWEGMT